jgi:hypothetical protein
LLRIERDFSDQSDEGDQRDRIENGEEGRISNPAERDKYPIYPALAGHGISKVERAIEK